MDMKKGRGKNSQGNGGQRAPSAQDLLASQLGMAGLFDPTLMGAAGMMHGGFDAQQLLAGAGGMPLMDPTTLAALGAMGGLPPGGFPPGFLPGNAAAAGADWVAMAQQAQLLAAMGGSVPPQFLTQMNAANPFGNFVDQNSASSNKQSSSSSSKRNATSSSGNRKSPVPSSVQGSKNSWPGSNATSSRMTPNHSSPRPSTPSRQSRKIKSPQMTASETVSKVISNQYEALAQKQAQTEQIMQAELMRQFEQQFILHQMQLQQQQEQIQAALQVLNKKEAKSSQSSQRSSSAQQLNSSLPNVGLPPEFFSPNSSLKASQPSIEALLALGQMPQSSGQQSGSNRSRSSSKASSSHGATSSGRSSSRSRDQPQDFKSPSRGNDHTLANALDSNFMAALYSQMQQPDHPPGGSLPSFLNPPSDRKSSPKPNEIRSRRKQANPTSVANSLQRQTTPSPLGGNSNRDASQTSPLPLVKAKATPEAARSSSSPVRLVKQFPQRKSQSPSFNTASSKSQHSVPSFSEKDFLAALQGQGQGTNQPTQEDLNKLMIAAYSEMISGGGKSGDLNKINELLTATVAAEMHRLQMEQLNLTRELENLSNGKPGSKRKDSASSERGNRVSVIHKAQPTHSGDEFRDREHDKGNKTSNDRSNFGRSSSDGEAVRTDDIASYKPQRKRRRLLSNEVELKEPLQLGWTREVRFTGTEGNLTSEVMYISPGGNELSSMKDVIQLLSDGNESKFGQHHFSFAANVRIGSFYHRPSPGEDEQWKKLNPPDAEKYFAKLDESLGVYESEDSETDDRHDRSSLSQNAQKLLEDHCFREAGQKAMKQAAELKLQQKNEQRRLAKLLRQKERQQRLEQQKAERELRERQLLEERQKLEAARQMKYQEALRKAKEREMQRQQALMFKQQAEQLTAMYFSSPSQERERRRQHLILLKNIETKRRAEERDRRREELRNEKIYIRERKLEQRRRAMKLARELKMPVEDMKLKSHQPLPHLGNLQGTIDEQKNSGRWTQLSGNATADVLMVLEFLITFKDAILLDESVIPTFEQLQRGLLNDPEHTGSLVQLTMALLHQCLCDPGVPAPGPWLHCATGVKVTDVDVSKSNYSEILRLFLWARNGHKTELALCLETRPFPSLSGDQKAEILAFLVNELVCSQPVCADIDRHLEKLASLRRDKWVVEGKIRQARVEHANDGSDASSNSPLKSRVKLRQPISGETEDRDEKDSAKATDDDSNQSSSESKCIKTETPMEKKMKKLTKEHQAFNEKMFVSSKPLRALDLGQDRYKRRYWVLSNVGGVYVEGLESGGWIDDEGEMSDEEPEEKPTDVKSEVKTEIEQEVEKPEPDQAPVEKMKVETTDQILTPTEDLAQVENETPNTEDKANVSDNVSPAEENTEPSLPLPDAVQPANDAAPPTNEQHALANGPVKITEGAAPDGESPSVQNLSMDCSVPEEGKDTKTVQDLSENFRATTSPLVDVNGIAPSNGNDLSRASHDVIGRRYEEEDSVVAAAKAIAAKAVASSSHILYPNQNKTIVHSPDLRQTVNQDQNQTVNQDQNPVKSHLPSPGPLSLVSSKQVQREHTSSTEGTDVAESLAKEIDNKTELGKLTALTLQSIGVDPSKLSHAQIEALTRISAPNADGQLDAVFNFTRPNAVDSPQLLNADRTEKTTTENIDENLQNAPIDLSRPSAPQRSETASPASVTSGHISSIHPAQAALAFGGLPPGVFDNFMIYKGDVANSELMAAVKQEFGSEENFEMGLRWKTEDQYDVAKPIPRETKYGWWKIRDEKLLDNLTENLHSRGIREKHLSRSIAKHRSFCTDAMSVAKRPEYQFANGPEPEPPVKDEIGSGEEKETAMETDQPKSVNKKGEIAMEPEDVLEVPEETAFQIEMETLKQVEELSDRCVAVGILNKAWSTTPKASTNRMDLAHIPFSHDDDPNVKHDCSNPVNHDPRSVMHAAVELVRKLELALSRLYLKPPLIRKGGATEFSNLPSLSESGVNDVAAGLRTWRNAVSAATSAAQLSMCVTMLESCIAWEKTPMSSTRSDASPRTKKRRPASKSTTTSSSGASLPKKKKSSSKIVDSPTPDPLYIDESSHMSARMPIDTADILKPGDKLRDECDSSTLNDVTRSDDDHDDVGSTLPFGSEVYADETSRTSDVSGHGSRDAGVETKKKKKKSKKKKDKDKEKDKGDKAAKRKKSHTTFCREMLRELQSHDSANWFLYPVDLNEVPDYKKIIKKPIDFSTIGNRLKKGRYKNHEMFSAEVRTVFDNCRTYNEDESAIGRAGHDLREFFERRWGQVLDANRDLIEASSMDFEDGELVQ
uniref:Bromodomain adjacent to zinc finger domain protein 2B n=1 Tax=Phallusia mammillata TaxID=59560 RepID=A0A6F9D6W0_9ASCI|nr:bromodomain adjacent to zinc finger domain protein 2B [Phallusia mammillata]